ncbi:MAG: AAA family ATPase [Anaerolineae bacterium]|nr:AAA family ATPase [Anaerolineae bacterium]
MEVTRGPDAQCSLRRVIVVGAAGAGKTTFARRLAGVLGCPHYEKDRLWWGPGWTRVPVEIFCERMQMILLQDSWVFDGNWRAERDPLWRQANTVVWLNYELPVVLCRLARRTHRRLQDGAVLWAGNRESWQRATSEHSVLLHSVHSHHAQQVDYPRLFARPAYRHLEVVRLHTPAEAESWLVSLAQVQAMPGLPFAAGPHYLTAAV